MNEQEFAELAAGHALDALSPEDLAAFEAARTQHPEWERQVRTDAATAAMLADGVPAVQPPSAVRKALLARIAAPLPEPAPDTAAVQAVARRNWTRTLLGLAASLVLLVALGFAAVTIRDLLTEPTSVTALEQIEAAPDAQTATAEVIDGGTATVHWSETLGKAVLVSDGLPTIADDETFELWFVRDGAPVSAGTFDEGSDTGVLLEGSLEPGDVIAVTVEQQGGSPSGEPTSDPIVTIPTAA